jgi:hypothetical protein
MHYRARAIGAGLEVSSQPGGGTRVACLFTPKSADSPTIADGKVGREEPVRLE